MIAFVHCSLIAIFHKKQFKNSLQLCLLRAVYFEIILLHGNFPLNSLYDLMIIFFLKNASVLLLKGSPYTVIGRASIHSRTD